MTRPIPPGTRLVSKTVQLGIVIIAVLRKPTFRAYVRDLDAAALPCQLRMGNGRLDPRQADGRREALR
jgi:hypothetical protein